MQLSDFDYDLPPGLIAQRPPDRRSDSRLMWLDRNSGWTADRRIGDLPELLKPGDLLVTNDTRVFPARLQGRKPSGGQVELLLVEPLGQRPGWHRWLALGRSSKGLKLKQTVVLSGNVRAKVRQVLGDGKFEIEINHRGDHEQLMKYIDEAGSMPLPPYIKREADEHDVERYQTIYARNIGAVAAPTAGLHFTDQLFAKLKRRGVKHCSVTLHVGPGTFLPMRVEDPREHQLEPEAYAISEQAAQQIEATRKSGGRIVAVGTTVVRTLEGAAASGSIHECSGRSGLLIYPGFEFRAVDLLLTNFHVPRSSLLMLVSAFAGTEHLLAAYRRAVELGYRFYSYGDAMLIGPGLTR
ncbi:MAG: tRNA preQ1(34) S-adenosylmethionine ribosyltransferase-isomerase QueA [Candidatus Alcyoniella australis]|nr:tRNA preQ1(34) S-adenosylmethionine ribosyltransferase-isomerase QueA [Candidatus Alcyoniella australis]